MSLVHSRLNYLRLADMDYLSARLLLANGLLWSGLPKASESIEKLIKLFLVLEAKINRNEHLTAKQIRKYGHNLPELLNALRQKVPVEFNESWDRYFQSLQDAYSHRYPETWQHEMSWKASLEDLDSCYAYLRTNVTANFPFEEQEIANKFGAGLFEVFTGDFMDSLRAQGGSHPKDILALNNKHIDSFLTP